jgi:hypothetical protein
MEVIDGALLDVNLAESVLSGPLINFIPADMRKKYPEIFSSKNTEFKQLTGSATIRDGKAYTEDLVVSAAEFEARGKGWYAFERAVDLQGPLLFSRRFSQDIIARAKELRSLADDRGQIVIPWTWSGKIPGAKVRPDLGYIAQAMQKGFVNQGLESFFGRRSSRDRGDRAESSSSPEEARPGGRQRKKRDSTEDILRGFEGLFRK